MPSRFSDMRYITAAAANRRHGRVEHLASSALTDIAGPLEDKRFELGE